MMKLGNSKKEIRIVKCFFGIVIIVGIILTIWFFCVFDWVFALMGAGIYWFFAFSPFYGSFFEVGTDEQRDKQNKKYAYKKKRGWE